MTAVVAMFFSWTADWRMEHLVLNIRHGDRSAIHQIGEQSPHSNVTQYYGTLLKLCVYI